MNLGDVKLLYFFGWNLMNLFLSLGSPVWQHMDMTN